jgi:hypothetical protein
VDPFSAEETADYIRHRLRAAALPEDLLEAETLARIHQNSGGVPGLINRFGADALAGAGTQAEVSRMPPTPELALAVEQESRWPQATSEEIATVEDPPAAVFERQHTIVPPTQLVVTPQAIRPPGQMGRLRRSVRIWRALAILVGVAFLVELTQDAWLDHLPAAFASLWRPAVPPTEPAEPERASQERASPVPAHAKAADSLTDPAAPPGHAVGHSDFAALHAFAAPPENAAFALLPKTTNAPETLLPRSTASAPAAPESAPTPDRVSAGSRRARESRHMTQAQRREIARLYAERAEYELRKGEEGAASLSIQRGLSADPRNPRLLELRPKVLEALRQP